MISSKYLWLLVQQLRKIWVRVVSFAVLAIVTLIAAQLLGDVIPEAWTDQVGPDAVDQVLGILTSSMLAVTTFSLSIAVSAFAAAAGSATPRATALLQEDPTTQNVLATFLGTFLFSLLGIIALKAGYYSEAGLLVLYIATVGVIIFVVVALLRWISHLMSFGRIEDTLDRVEAAADNAIKKRMARPWLGGTPQTGPPSPGEKKVFPEAIGHVQHVDMQELSKCAEAMKARVRLLVLPGSFAHRTTPILSVEGGPPSEAQLTALRATITIGRRRDFDQDPRYGIVVLAEIASRALSPAVNDPGTAIWVIGHLVRVLSQWHSDVTPEVDYPNVIVPTLRAADLIEDGFRPIARDGAGFIEVQMGLHGALSALRNLHPQTYDEIGRDMARDALQRSMNAGLPERELAKLRDISGIAPEEAEEGRAAV
ncbi:hypothetical protein FIU97_16520 [Roseivivax sp. THAF40]|uniref:DUF2254 domain-containing protein n=1 Tax=unclassified Roseivivax TaxID=2639302 RepID=UPI001269676F|nr:MULTISPECIES: DUF2254 domain-containing protein [unclassified Roseivivax]QFS84361.1 hypothetical protein FIV09_16105 [Roseivivax sp. THAF197b]QFT48189.1 hypothetical protein FIU97_16520 [Roseivivax sp. THAF40]